MVNDWRTILKYDPVIPLISSDNEAIVLFAKRDLLDNKDRDVKDLWNLPTARRIVKKQQGDGSWKYPGGNLKIRTAENYDQIETFRQLGYLVEMFGFTEQSQVIPQAVDFLLSYQAEEGDIRGILGNQYAPYYTAAMLELMIKAGYAQDIRVNRAFAWLKSIRQNDGGWAIPLRTRGKKLDAISMGVPTLEPDKSEPFSHLVTGVVLRAYAAHPAYRRSAEAQAAGKLLRDSLFKSDNYPDRKNKDYWLRFTFPFWFTDLISAMDSLSILGFSKDEPQINKAVQWFIDNQQSDGLWKLKALKNLKYDNDLWLSLSICRILKRLLSESGEVP